MSDLLICREMINILSPGGELHFALGLVSTDFQTVEYNFPEPVGLFHSLCTIDPYSQLFQMMGHQQHLIAQTGIIDLQITNLPGFNEGIYQLQPDGSLPEQAVRPAESGIFESALSRPTSPTGTTRTSSTRKYICPCCGNSFRATKNVNVGCPDCHSQMLLA